MRNLLWATLTFVVLFPLLAVAQDQDEDSSEKDDDEVYNELIEDTEEIAGFWNFYRKDDKLYLEVPDDKLNEDFLLNFQIARGIGSSGLYGGTMLNIFESNVVALQKHDNKIFLVNKPHRYKAAHDSPEQEAVELTYGESVLETASIEATRSDSVMLINVYDWFVGDLSHISNRVQYAVSSTPGQPGRATFDKERSHLESVKSFPENSNVQARLTFHNQEQSGPRTLADSRFIPVSIFYTLAQLPDEPMKPRKADDRVGYFMTVHKDFTGVDDTFFERKINRWRLECEAPVAGEGLCEPKEPIVYYLEETIPERYREPMTEGVEAWSDAFEEAGFRNAVRAEMLPDSIDAGDIRYATLRWNVSDQPGYGAIGPSTVDPRTGEILDADILFEANMILGFKDTYRNMVDPKRSVEEMFVVDEEEFEAMKRGIKTESFYHEMGTQGNLMRTALLARGEMKPSEPMPEEFVDEAVRWVTMHEVGHTLGLRHNFRSATDTPLDKLHDREWTRENGVFSSVMEYPSPNIAPADQENGFYYNPGVGSYDRWVISYGYSEDDERAENIARQAAQPGHAYATDEDVRGSGAIDPSVNVYSLSADPLGWGQQRADLIRTLYPELPEIALDDDMPYYEVTDLFQSIFFQYGRALAPAVKYIGGQYQYRDHVGDPDGRMPFEPVPFERQQEALNLIINYGFASDVGIVPQEVYRKFGANRWSHWGMSNTYQGRIDFPLHSTVLGIQTGLLNQLLNPTRLSRIRDTELKFGRENTVTIPELMSRLSEAIWEEAWTAPGTQIPGIRRDLQRVHLNAMIRIVTEAPSNMPADARSVARTTLQDLHDRLDRRLTPPVFDFNDYTEAHLIESRDRINRALEAGFNLEN
ncbi:MAG: zinc-dependent metalloprotease [Balneolaceae bacterium]